MPNVFRVVGLTTCVFIADQASGLAAQTITVGQKWEADKQVSIHQIDHQPYSRLLSKSTDHQGMVNYAAWKSSKPDQQILETYLKSLSQADRSQPASREARLTFWINAYNAVTIHGILREYPTSSIRNHTAKLVGYNIWDDLQLIVGDDQYSLNRIEHEILRTMNEPRIHFAIVCASIGCPRLLAEAYTADRLEQQLAENSRHFFADPNKFRADFASGKLHVSPILQWFGKDFGAKPAERLRTIAPYLPDEASRQLAASGKAKLAYLGYDWNLNDQASTQTKN